MPENANVVVGEVIEVPKPVRPDLFFEVHKHSHEHRWYPIVRHNKEQCEQGLINCTSDCFYVRIPGTDAPPAAPVCEDAVERLWAFPDVTNVEFEKIDDVDKSVCCRCVVLTQQEMIANRYGSNPRQAAAAALAALQIDYRNKHHVARAED